VSPPPPSHPSRLVDPWGLNASAFRIAGALILVALASACGGSDDSPQAGGHESFPEGEINVAVELLDTGLVKGNASAEAKSGWTVASMVVSAVDPRGANWQVLEFPKGVGSSSATEFFEIVLQELPRGQQLTITATVQFEAEDGNQLQRSAIDLWPP